MSNAKYRNSDDIEYDKILSATILNDHKYFQDHYFRLQFEIENFEKQARTRIELPKNYRLHGLSKITSLEDVDFASGCELFGLCGITTLKVLLARRCHLNGLENVKSFDNAILARYCVLGELYDVVSLDGLQFAKNCELHGLSNLKSLRGVKLPAGCKLFDLIKITSLSDVKLANRCGLYGLSSTTSLDGLEFAENCKLHGLTRKILPWYWGEYMNSSVINIFGY